MAGELRIGGRCQRHPLNILPCTACAAEFVPGVAVDVLDMLTRMVQERGSQKAVAEALDISEQYLSDVLRDRREPGEKLLDALGVERVVTYRRKGKSGVPGTPNDQRQVREDSQGLGEPGRLSPFTAGVKGRVE